MNTRTKELAFGALKIFAKVGKKVLIEGGKVALAGALIVGMEKIYKGGVEELKASTIDDLLELDSSEDEYV